MAEALTHVKSAMGHDAVIMHTRTYQQRSWMGLKSREIVEITAGQGLPARSPRRPAPMAAAAGPAAYLRNRPAAGIVQAPAKAAAAVLPPGRQLLESSAASTAMMAALGQEMGSLKSMIKDLVAQQRRACCPQVPENLHEYYLRLIENQVAEELAADIVIKVQQQVRPEYLNQPQFICDKLAEQLEKLLPTSGPIARTKTSGAHVVALIGPTGVGKTTTIAKLAANLKLREKRSVGLITLDTYRIAAIDQLRKYADILGCPLKAVARPEDLPDALAALADCEFILIDTAGRSPNDTLKLNELKEFITLAAPDEVHLVLSTTASCECVELAVSRFGDVRVDKIIFTKLDEATHVGVVLNVIRKVNKSLSYITTGQDVPNDIEVGGGRRLAQMILGSHL